MARNTIKNATSPMASHSLAWTSIVASVRLTPLRRHNSSDPLYLQSIHARNSQHGASKQLIPIINCQAEKGLERLPDRVASTTCQNSLADASTAVTPTIRVSVDVRERFPFVSSENSHATAVRVTGALSAAVPLSSGGSYGLSMWTLHLLHADNRRFVDFVR